MIEGFNPIAERPVRRLQIAQRIFPAFLIFSILAFSGNGTAYAGPMGAVTATYGTVMLSRPGAGQDLVVRKGDDVLVGDELRTGKKSGARLSFADGAFVDLAAESALRVNQYAFDAGEGRRTARVRVLGGRARFVLYKTLGRESAFYVETNDAMVIPGMLGDFGVSVGPSGTQVAVLAQSVRVKNVSGLIVGELGLGTNRKTVVTKRTAPSSPVTLTREERNSYREDMRRFRRNE